MENTSSHSSCISRPVSVSAGESSWAMHIAGFLASSTHSDREMDHQGGGGGASESSFSSGFSSSFDSLGDDDDSFITPDMVCDADEDDSLQDTACSSTAGPKVTSMNDMCMKSILAMDAKEMNNAQLDKYFFDAGSRQQEIAGVAPAQEVLSGGNSNEKQLYECNDLRKKGLCLVPLSMLIDYLG